MLPDFYDRLRLCVDCGYDADILYGLDRLYCQIISVAFYNWYISTISSPLNYKTIKGSWTYYLARKRKIMQVTKWARSGIGYERPN